MKKMLIIFILIIFFFALSCNQANEDNQLNTTDQQNKTVTIGLLATLTGPASVHGTHVLIGAEKAVEELKAQGAAINLVIEDNKNDPKEAITAYHRLLQQKPDVIFTTMSGASATIIPLAQDAGIPIITSLTYADFQKYDRVFQYFQTPETLSTIASDFFKKKNITKVALLSQNIEAGHALMDIAQKKFEEQGISITGLEYYLPTDTDHKTVITKLAASKPEAMYVFDLRPDTIVKEIKNQFDGVIVFTDTPLATNQHKTISDLDGVYAAAQDYMINSTASYQKFTELFAGKDPNAEAGYGYDVIHLIWQAHLQGDLPDSILKLKQFNGIVGNITLDSRRPYLQMQMVQIKNKELLPVE